MKTLFLASLVGTAAMLPATASASDSAPGDTAQNRVIYDDSVLMHDDRVIDGRSVTHGGSSTYQGDWSGAYREDGTYQGEWQGTYRDADGRVYDGQYAGTFIGEGNPSPVPSQIGASYVEAPLRPAIVSDHAGTDYEAPRYEDQRPQYSRAPAPEYRAPVPHPPYGAQYQTQYRYPSGWNGYYYPAYYYPAGTTIVIQPAPGTTTTTTYYED